MDIVKENLQEVGTSKLEENEHAKKQVPETQSINPREQTLSRRPPVPRYQTFFSGLCYACNNYGHKAIDCRTCIIYGYNWGRNRYESPKYQEEMNYNRRSQMGPNINYNRFEALDYDIECYRCHNFGHIARNCGSKITGPQDQFRENRQASMHQTNWRGRQEASRTEGCKLSLTIQNSRDHWCVDSGCSRHMTGNKNTFQKLQAKTGTITFRNDSSSKVPGKGTITLGSKDASTKDVLLIENMRHNLLNVSQICDQGHVLTFTSKDCKIRRKYSRKLVATTSKTPSNIYILDEIKK